MVPATSHWGGVCDNLLIFSRRTRRSASAYVQDFPSARTPTNLAPLADMKMAVQVDTAGPTKEHASIRFNEGVDMAARRQQVLLRDIRPLCMGLLNVALVALTVGRLIVLGFKGSNRRPIVSSKINLRR
jgi:hypothetical protein